MSSCPNMVSTKIEVVLLVALSKPSPAGLSSLSSMCPELSASSSSNLHRFASLSLALSYLEVEVSQLWLSLWPRLKVGTQSWLVLSYKALGLPDMKWSEHTLVCFKLDSFMSLLLIAASHFIFLSSLSCLV